MVYQEACLQAWLQFGKRSSAICFTLVYCNMAAKDLLLESLLGFLIPHEIGYYVQLLYQLKIIYLFFWGLGISSKKYDLYVGLFPQLLHM